MSDEELDKIFKNAADGFSADETSADWTGMASKLDRAEKSVWYRRGGTYFFLLGLVLVSSLSIWYLSHTKESKQKIGADITISNHGSTAKEEIIPAKEVSDQNPDPLSRGSQAVNPVNSNSNTDGFENTNNSLPSGGDKRESFSTDVLASARVKVDSEDVYENWTSLQSHQSVTAYDKEKSNSTQSNRLVASNSVNPVVGDSIASVAKEETSNDVLEDAEIVEGEEKKKDERKRFSLKLSVAPDFSSTEFFNQGKPGFDFGITAGYNFNKNWSVYTGIVLAKKIYSSSNIDEPYNTSTGYSYEIEKLDGDCRILDIPLNVYYSFSSNRSFAFKAGLGFSSYIMLSEDYTYYVDKGYGSSEYYQRVENENNEWFKMLNLSVVVQKRLSNNFFLEVEPFVKLPMAGIGAGDISLYTVGSFMSLRYDFYKHK